MSKKKRFFSTKLGRFIVVLLALLLILNLIILFTGRTYLYKGIQETYLKGRKGPGIYDSLVFPTRVAPASTTPFNWPVSASSTALSSSSKKLLEETNTTSFLIVKNGEIVHESYYENHNENVRSNTFSMAKSFIGLMIGIAVDEGKIESLDDPISAYLPFHLAGEERVTVRDLLGMSSGLDWSESGSDPFSDNAEAYYTTALTAMMKKKKFTWKPGSKFEYASGNSQLLGLILQEATGKHPTDYFEEKVWSKIGAAHDLLWSLDHKEGIEKTFCCGYATTRDYAKVGQLILNKGKWYDQTIISNGVLEELTSPYSKQEPQYGLQFWIFNHPEHPAVYLRGILGQYIFVIPSLDVVMVRTGHNRKEVYHIPEKEKNNKTFVTENGYKEYHPLDVLDYYTILYEVFSSK